MTVRQLTLKIQNDTVGSQNGPVLDSRKHHKESSSSIICGEFLHYLRKY